MYVYTSFTPNILSFAFFLEKPLVVRGSEGGYTRKEPNKLPEAISFSLFYLIKLNCLT